MKNTYAICVNRKIKQKRIDTNELEPTQRLNTCQSNEHYKPINDKKQIKK